MPEFAIQDANIFYVYSKNKSFLFSISAPSHIRINGDYDVTGAAQAREWFENAYPEIIIR